MKLLLLRAEWRRMLAHRLNLWIAGTFALLMLAGAISAGLGAREHRARAELQTQQFAAMLAEAGQASADTGDGARGLAAATRAFALGRHDAAVARLPASGGLVLATQRFDTLSPELRISVESRHADSRKSEQLLNPLLAELGVPDFVTLVILLLPLAAIGLAQGLVQADRELGIWRMVVAQSTAPGAVLACALLLRGAVLLTIAWLASALAFWLDPSSTLVAWLAWALGLALFTAVWVLATGCAALLPIGAATSTLALIATWLATSFLAPAAIALHAEREHPMPSRLEAVVAMRAAQQNAETTMNALTRDWYAAHPDVDAPVKAVHPWPISFVSRYLALDAALRPLMNAFDEQRARQAQATAVWGWLSPSLALTEFADRLAGIDAIRYLHYVQAVDRDEDAWRAALVPRIMGYRGVSTADLDTVPTPAATANLAQTSAWGSLSAFLLLIALLLVLAASLRRHAACP